MTESQDRPSHHVLDLLASLGFQKTYRYGQHAVVYEFKEFTFEATEHPVNDKFQHVILFTGIYRDRRVIAEIKHEIPPFMDDIRTLKALLFYMVGSYVTFDPPYWLQEGEKVPTHPTPVLRWM